MKSTTQEPRSAGVAGGPAAAETEQDKRTTFAARIGQDACALRRVADHLHDIWVGGGPDPGREGELAAMGHRVLALALAQIELSAEDAGLPTWDPTKEPGR